MISTIITAFNSEAYLSQAIESVLQQTSPADEILVIDDGSSDATASIARQYSTRVHYHWQTNQGPGAARAFGIRESKGDLLAFLDSDDLWMPRKLELQVAALNEDPAIGLVFPHLQQFKSPDLPAAAAALLRCDETPHPAPLISGIVLRRSVFERVGPLRTGTKTDFVDWYMRAQEAGVVMRILPDVLVKRRIHTANYTLQNKDVRQEYLQVLKAARDRRRNKVSEPTTSDAA